MKPMLQQYGQMPHTLCPFFKQFDPFLRPLHAGARVVSRRYVQKSYVIHCCSSNQNAFPIDPN